MHKELFWNELFPIGEGKSERSPAKGEPASGYWPRGLVFGNLTQLKVRQ